MRFNTNTKTRNKPNTTNLAGGNAYAQSAELELASILLTSFVEDQYYRGASDTVKRVKELIPKCDPKFVAQAAVYARTVFGMRSITHVLASEAARSFSGQPWAKNFYERVIYRPDDMTEIMAYHMANNGKLPKSMQKGFAAAFGKFDAYQLAKYRGEKKDVKLVDVVNLVHPVPTPKNEEALKALVEGTLRSTSTWESKLSESGQKAKTEEEKLEMKAESWRELLSEKGKLGYLALLRNLRNIMEQAPDMIDRACELLTDRNTIKRQLIMPFQFYVAYLQFSSMSDRNARKIVEAIDDALDISVENVPKFDGDTLVVCDYSGSMDSNKLSNMGTVSMRQIGTVMGAVLAKSNNADFMIFGSRAAYVPFNRKDSVTSIIASTDKHNRGGYGYYGVASTSESINVDHGTNANAIFETANKKYQRILILSDLQVWMYGGAPTSSLAKYKSTYKANPYIYSIDLAGHGSSMLPEKEVYALAGFSNNIFDVMQKLETDRNALVNSIKEVEL